MTDIQFKSAPEVSLVAHQGDDDSIVSAARVSVVGEGAGGEDASEHGGLIRYLMAHRHGTPFEHNSVTLRVHAPIFVFREWHRHRVQCVVGDTEITCLMPSGAAYKKTVRHIYESKHGKPLTSATRSKNGTSKGGAAVTRAARLKVEGRVRALPNCQERTLRVLDEETGRFTAGRMAEVWSTGVKPILRVALQDGSTIRVTAEHPLLTSTGWVKAGDLMAGSHAVGKWGMVAGEAVPIPPYLRRGIGVWTSMMRSRLIGEGAKCHYCGELFGVADLALDHFIPVVADLRRALDVDNLVPACGPCHRLKTNGEQKLAARGNRQGVRWVTVESVIPDGDEETFDIELDGPHHNYLANDLVVHNSFNEQSGRYSQLEPIFHIPAADRPLVNAGTSARPKMVPGTPEQYSRQVTRMTAQYKAAYSSYLVALDDGVAKEVAREVLPVGIFSTMYVTANLRAWLHFLSLRTHDPEARFVSYPQYEIEQAAELVEDIVADLFPITMQAFVDSGRVAP